MTISKIRLAVLAVIFAVGFSAIGAGTALAVQGHMLNARSYLTSAYGQLNQATPDKAGHRVQAMSLIRQAINQVNWGIQAGAY
jgi:hypothetical protein